MQSRARRPGNSSVVHLVFAGMLPLAGYIAELSTGMFEDVGCQLFPTPWHTATVGLAVALNLLLCLGLCASERLLPWRAAAVAFVTGTTLLYALAELPHLPIILVGFMFGLGVLAFAPYWTCLGFLWLWPDLMRQWKRSPRRGGQLAAILVPLVLLAPVTATATRLHYWRTSRWMQQAASSSEPAVAQAALAALRTAPLGAQLELCADGAGTGPRAWRRNGFYWFIDNLDERSHLSQQEARLAFYRAHGEDALERELPTNRQNSRFFDFGPNGALEPGNHTTSLDSSSLLLTVEPEAAVAKVDWQLRFTNRGDWNQEADLELLMSPDAVASGLSLWVAGTERPAAFGGVRTVQAAYDEIAVQQRRDPALLQEVAPGCLRLRVFPVPARGGSVQARVLLTMPLHLRDDGASLQLPSLHSTRCSLPSRHAVQVVDGTDVRDQSIENARLGDTVLSFRRGASRSRCRDADGDLVQELMPRAPSPPPARLVLVVDASASAGARLPHEETLFAGLPADLPCAMFMAGPLGFTRRDGPAGELGEWLRTQPFAGGIDAAPALQAAIEARGTDTPLVWLHGRQALLGAGTQQLLARLYQSEPICTLALAEGINVVRQRLAARIRRLPRTHDLAADLRWLLLHFDTPAVEPFALAGRVFLRAEQKPAAAAPVSDQMARLCAAQTARALASAGDWVGGAQLATRFRLATAGAGAVVLETDEQYDRHQLDPGAAVGTEPPEAIGGGPVPELPVWLMVLSGLAVAAFRLRRARVT